MIKQIKKGFTVVELVIVIAVIGILAAILIPTFITLVDNANDTTFQAEARDAYVMYTTEQIQNHESVLPAEDLAIVKKQTGVDNTTTPIIASNANEKGAAFVYIDELWTLATEGQLDKLTYIGEYNNFYFWSNEIVPETYVRTDKDGNPDDAGEYMTFGIFPRTIKEESVVVDESKPTAVGNYTYYPGNDGEQYSKVKATPDRYGRLSTLSNGIKPVEDQDYFVKVEPLLWKILKETSDQVFLTTVEIVYASMVTPLNASSEYKLSKTREWLTGEFYNTAFNSDDKNVIKTTEVDNSAASLGDFTIDPNSNPGENTFDKVFLLSSSDLINSEYGLDSSWDREAKGNDFSILNKLSSGSSSAMYWTRSTTDIRSYNAIYVSNIGTISQLNGHNDFLGVRPAINIKL